MGNTTDRVMGGGNQYNAVFTDKTDNAAMGPSDFMKLMVAQMQNQDFTNPMDNSQMITQMAQFSNMQQMQEMAAYSKSNYAMSMVGKNVTASRFTTAGELDTTTGPVQKVSMVDNEYILYVGGKKYTLAQVMAVQSGSTGTDSPSLVDPAGYPLETKDVKSDTATLNWKVPTEDSMTAAGLKYTVYYAKYVDGQDDPENPGETIRQKFDTVEQVESGTLAGDKEKTGVTTVDLMNLEPGTQYYANVVVTDETGTKLVYKPIKFKTLT